MLAADRLLHLLAPPLSIVLSVSRLVRLTARVRSLTAIASSAGYWNLANSDNDWSPPDDLEEFMQKAERDGKPLVYIVSVATLAFLATVPYLLLA